MNKRIISLLLVLAFALCLLAGCGKKEETADSGITIADTTPLAQGDLKNTITTLVTVTSANQVDVATSVGAPIQTIDVQLGDNVTIGQTLCTLDTTALKDDLALKQKALATAETDYTLALQRAERALTDAQNQLAIDEQPYTDAIDKAKSAYATATVNAAAIDTLADVAAAKTAMNDAAAAQQTAKTALDAANAALAADPDNASLQTAAQGAQAAYDTATANATNTKTNYDNLWNAAFDREWMALYNSPECAASADVKKAVAAYDDAKLHGLRGDYLSIESARDGVTDAKRNTTAVDNAKNDVKKIQDQLAKCVIVAPANGTIVVMKAALDATPSAADALFSISDSSDFVASGLLNQYDSTRVVSGAKAEVTTDATGDTVMNGVVKLVSPTAADSSGDFTVTVTITDPSPELRSGMTGKVHIVLSEADDCFYVPTDSIGMDDNGNSVVYSYTGADDTGANGTINAITVTTGIATDYYTQISGDGLQADMPILNTPQ